MKAIFWVCSWLLRYDKIEKGVVDEMSDLYSIIKSSTGDLMNNE